MWNDTRNARTLNIANQKSSKALGTPSFPRPSVGWLLS